MEYDKVEYEYFDNGNIKNEYWYNKYGRLNRTDGPAAIEYDKSHNIICESYFLNGKKLIMNFK